MLLGKRFANVSVEVSGGKGAALEQIPQRDSLDSLLSRSAVRRQIDFPIDMLPGLPQGEGDKERKSEGEGNICVSPWVSMCCCSVVIYAPARSFDMSKVVSPD